MTFLSAEEHKALWQLEWTDFVAPYAGNKKSQQCRHSLFYSDLFCYTFQLPVRIFVQTTHLLSSVTYPIQVLQ